MCLCQMQRSGSPAGAFPLLAYRLPIPFQRFPHWFPILCRRFHDCFLGVLLEQPCSERSQLLGVAAKHTPLKLESTAQYWKPVWEALERYWKPIREKREGARRRSGTLHLAQAQSNRGRRGRKNDFRDAERLVKRLVARELTLSFVPDAEQRLWRTVTRKKYQLRRDRVRLQNQLESLLEEAHIKLSSLVSDLLGASARRMLKALADGETNPAALATLADQKLRATSEQLCDALGACTDLKPVYRRLLKMALEHLQLLEQQIGLLDQELATLLHPHKDAVLRLAEVPGLGVDSAMPETGLLEEKARSVGPGMRTQERKIE